MHGGRAGNRRKSTRRCAATPFFKGGEELPPLKKGAANAVSGGFVLWRVSAEDVGNGQRRRTRWWMRVHVGHSGQWGRGDPCGDRVERGAGRGDQSSADVYVARGSADGGVTEQHLDHAQIGAGLQAMRRKGVPLMPISA